MFCVIVATLDVSKEKLLFSLLIGTLFVCIVSVIVFLTSFRKASYMYQAYEISFQIVEIENLINFSNTMPSQTIYYCLQLESKVHQLVFFS